jgi:hypothetical protein
MKKFLVLLCGLTFFTNTFYAQTVEDLFQNSPIKITWLGIDYSHVKLIGSFSNFNETTKITPEIIKNDYFVRWNELILKESNKYTIDKMFRKKDINYNIEGVTAINAQTDLTSIEQTTSPNYTELQLQQFVKNYYFNQSEGIGLMFVAETLNKTSEEAIYHVLAINLTNNEILLSDKFITKPGGFGLRNYWASSYLKVIEAIRDHKYPAYKKKYLHKKKK